MKTMERHRMEKLNGYRFVAMRFSSMEHQQDLNTLRWNKHFGVAGT